MQLNINVQFSTTLADLVRNIFMVDVVVADMVQTQSCSGGYSSGGSGVFIFWGEGHWGGDTFI